MSEVLTMTKEELEAMRIAALLRGVSPSELSSEAFNNEDDDFEIEIVDEEKPKKKGKGRAKKKEDVPKKPSTIQFVNGLEKADTKVGFSVEFNAHDIHYKEQLWPIPSREVKYNLEVSKWSGYSNHVAKDFIEKGKLKGIKLEDEKVAISEGRVMYVKITTYENVNSCVKDIGHIRIEMVNEKPKMIFDIKKKIIKDNHANVDKVEKNIKEKAKLMFA